VTKEIRGRGGIDKEVSLINVVTLLGYARVTCIDPLSPSVEGVSMLSLCYGMAG